ncbi:hypothetical protein [Limnospira platensis]|uniref:hypothetical protein n=1 Tax=Limnospira platensis TaxID=118562 RepID=UPI0021AA9B56|nr:hypothetical protein APLC1_2242 [Arthrospira platensis C1]
MTAELIPNPTQPESSRPNPNAIDGGLIIEGFMNQENRLIGTGGSDLIAGGDLNDVIYGGTGAIIPYLEVREMT